MKSLISLWLWAWLGLSALPAMAGQLAGLAPLARDELAAVAQLKATPERHVLAYFGDHVN